MTTKHTSRRAILAGAAAVLPASVAAALPVEGDHELRRLWAEYLARAANEETARAAMSPVRDALDAELPPLDHERWDERQKEFDRLWIKHGLEPRTLGGNVWILARASDDTVSVTVADDGEGFNSKTSGTGIGLKNVRERLRLVYGASASLAVVANFPAGVAATITVPAKFTRDSGNV